MRRRLPAEPSIFQQRIPQTAHTRMQLTLVERVKETCTAIKPYRALIKSKFKRSRSTCACTKWART